MTHEKKLRRQAIQEWSCPNHPDGPPLLPADGYEREELTLEEAYDDEFVGALRRLCALRARDGGLVAETLGLCCIGHEWKTVGYEMVEVGPFEGFLFEMRGPLLANLRESLDGSILLAEWKGSHPIERDPPDVSLRIPIVRDGE